MAETCHGSRAIQSVSISFRFEGPGLRHWDPLPMLVYDRDARTTVVRGHIADIYSAELKGGEGGCKFSGRSLSSPIGSHGVDPLFRFAVAMMSSRDATNLSEVMTRQRKTPKSRYSMCTFIFGGNSHSLVLSLAVCYRCSERLFSTK